MRYTRANRSTVRTPMRRGGHPPTTPSDVDPTLPSASAAVAAGRTGEARPGTHEQESVDWQSAGLGAGAAAAALLLGDGRPMARREFSYSFTNDAADQVQVPGVSNSGNSADHNHLDTESTTSYDSGPDDAT